MSMPERPGEPPRRWTVAAAIVAIIGLIILTISGLCTGAFGIGMIASVISEAGRLNSTTIFAVLSGLATVVIVGGIPMLIGFFITRAGFKMRKRD